jgi:branched-chain amino acid transport system substrate-binding protein
MKKLLIILLVLAFALNLIPQPVSAALVLQAAACEQDVVVQDDDWLSKLSDKFYGDILAFPAIVQATNQQNGIDDSYASIDNPDVIEPGWKLCIPSSADAQTLLAGESAPVAAAPASGEPITIGASLPLSGRFSEPGTAAKQGYEVWAAMVNEAGGLLGRPVELSVVDNASDQDTAVADYEKLITVDKVDLVVGPFSSFLVIPTSEVAARYGYAFVEPAGGSPEVFERGLNNIFFAQPARGAEQAKPFADYLLALPEDQKPKTFAIVSQDDPFTIGVMENLKGLLTEGGMELVFDEIYAPETTDFSSIATQVADLNPDLIVGGTVLEDSIGQIRAYQEAGYQPRIAYFTTGPSLPGPFREALGNATEGVFASISWFPEADEPQNADFVAKYVEMFGGAASDIPEDAANAFTVGQVLQQAAENINSIDNAGLIEDLHQSTYQTVVGPLSFDEVGAPQGSFMLLQWQSDKFVIVGPEGRAQAEALAPPKPEW